MKTKKVITIIISLIILNCSTTTAQVLEQDSLALVAFYNSTGGPGWYNNSNWLTGPVSTWYGVTVEGERVKELKFYSDNNLDGFIPEEIGSLVEVETFVIGNNPNLTGNLPNTINQLVNLQWFGIGNCAVTGTIPNGIGNLINLLFLNLSDNSLIGNVPVEIGNLSNLQFLILFGNQLTGPIPHELGNLTNLEELRLNDNQLTGSIPPELAGLINISMLYLYNNNLSGRLPESLINLFVNSNNPLFLNISDNDLSGKIPELWGNAFFNIGEFNMSWNDFSYLPPVNYNWLITYFSIKGNKLTFEHIESHYQSYQVGFYYFFYYYPQDDMMEEIDTTLIPGSSYSIYSGTGGEFTNYKWFKNGELILESPDADTLHLTYISYADTGIYTCQAESSLIYFLNLYRKPVHITLDTGTNISNNYYQRKYPAIYPNPASEEITVLLPFKQSLADLMIFDLEGKCVLSQRHIQANNSKITVGIKGLKSGIYLLRIQTENRNYSTKFIINKRGAKH